MHTIYAFSIRILEIVIEISMRKEQKDTEKIPGLAHEKTLQLYIYLCMEARRVSTRQISSIWLTKDPCLPLLYD